MARTRPAKVPPKSEIERMRAPGRTKTILQVSVLALLLASALSRFLAQEPSPSPTPSPEPSPSASPSPTPARVPSPTPLPGAQNFHQWGSITVFNGLPSDSVRAIAQTPDGVMWFGTDNGLARFDGRRIQNFSLGGPEANRILALEAVANGDLWIGTRNGAFIYSNLGLTAIENTLGIGITAIVGRGNDIFRAGTESDVVLGTETGFVLVVRKQDDVAPVSSPIFTDPIKSPDGLPAAITGLITTDHAGILAATAGRGVFFVDEGVAEDESALRAPSPFVNAIVRDSDFKVWLGIDAPRGGNGVVVALPGKPPLRISAPTSKVLTMVANEQGSWAGTERNGLFNFLDLKLKKSYTFANTSGGLRSDTIYTLFTDREGVLWIGTNRGVSRFDRLGASQEALSDSANANFIRTLFRSADGTIYAGSNRGLFRKVDDKWVTDASQGNRAIFAVSEDRAGKLLIGGAERISIEQNASTETATWAFEDFKGEKYAAVNGLGLVQLRAGGNVVRSQKPSISSLCAVGEKLYFGTTDKGLFSFDGRSVKNELAPEQLKSGTIWKMNSDATGTLWIAGQHGVFRVRDQQVERIMEAEEVRDVFIDGEYIWAATTTRGLLQARHDGRFGWLVSEVGFEQGLPSEKAFSILQDKGGILVATNRGVVTYRRGTVPPKLIATRIASQRSHDLKEAASTIALEYPQNTLLVEVAGQSSRTFPEEFQYAFVLTNSKGEEIGRQLSNEFQYSPSGLSPGEYLIEATAFNRDLLASDPLHVRFSIARAPFPWTATALGVLLAIALLGLAWAFVANRRVSVRNRELAAAKLDLAVEAERERRRIARDLHDQTLADLRSLMLRSDEAKPGISGLRDQIEAISGEVRRICEDLSPSVLENVGLVAALEFLLKDTIGTHRFIVNGNLEEGLGFSMNVQLQIYRIAQEILTNIKNHSNADRVEMEVGGTEGAFVMEIRDNGKAFSPGRVNGGGRGIANIRARASMIGAAINWEQADDAGNGFSLRVSK